MTATCTRSSSRSRTSGGARCSSRCSGRVNVRITGRLKDIIIRNAENISAAEVEEILRRHPGVFDIAVIGLPDERTGERVCAVAVPEPGHVLTLAGLSGHCAEQGMAAYKRPVQLEVIDVLPRNSMGKMLRNQLKDQFAR